MKNSLFAVAGQAALAVASAFDWDVVKPSQSLEYQDCFDQFQCARLILPLDWKNNTNTARVTIAVMRLPAVVEEDEPSFGGTIITQPGGPGIPGTVYLPLRHQRFRDFLDIPGKKHYELVAFDPRGIGMSTPTINCFPGTSGLIRLAEGVGAGMGNASSIPFAMASAKADYQQCEMIHGDFLSYLGTPNVARDMLALVDKIDERRQAQSEKRLELRSLLEEGAKPRLQYIGVSYGTILGQYFASLFPGRVGRMALDGVVDAYDWTHGMGWLTSTQDTDKMVELFFQGCFGAGSDCALYRKENASWHDIADRFWSWANSLDQDPLYSLGDGGIRIFVRTNDVHGAFLGALYDAVSGSRDLALLFDQAMRGNATLLFQGVGSLTFPRKPDEACGKPAAETPIPLDPLRAVLCADGANVTDLEPSDWEKYVEKQTSISELAGYFIASIRIGCAGWKTIPNWLFKGPFGTPQPSRSNASLDPGRPAAPLLLLSNRWDPVTPLRNAQAIVKNHPGSGIIVQESMGHCALLSAPGPCVSNALAEYFDTGAVPLEEITCKASHEAWEK